MAASRLDLLDANYRLRIRRLRELTIALIVRAYGTVSQDRIAASFDVFLPIAARQLAAGQAQAQTLTRAYVVAAVSASTGSRIDPVRTSSLAGTTKGGIPPAESIAGIRPMILTAIRDGRTIEDAMGLGGYLVRRFTDNELSRVVDTEFLAQGERHAVGWRGITHSPQDECIGNAGVHPFSRPMYRHGGCRCERVVVFEGVA